MSLQRQRQRALSKGMRDIAESVEQQLQRLTGQERTPMLLIVPVDGLAQYISNVDRASATAMMKEMLARWEAGHPDVPEHEKQ